MNLLPRKTAGASISTVFGCTGFAGKYIVNNLAKNGSQVVAPFRGEEKSIDRLKPMGEVGQIVPVKFSIRNEESIERALFRSNLVVHCLGKSHSTRNFSLEEANVESTRKIAKAAKKHGVERFIQISHVLADPKSPSDWFRTMGQAEEVVKETFPSATILRCTTLYGAEDRLLHKYGYLANFFPVIPVFQSLDTKLQPLCVTDLARSVPKVFLEDRWEGKTLELAGDDIFTLQEFLDYVEKYTGRPRPIIKVPSFLEKPVMWSFFLKRKPTFTPDDLKYRGDVLLSGKYPGLKELGIKPYPLDEMARTVLRQYRHPDFVG